ncbi:hypothetical protein KIW84_012760 [Lathyrus oleraceus]|uniref:Uncharacterized protein n=1 Tax=Pisum sativum TaxID=3888 RepID=A0A9D5GWS8_PEA|nr:hypothetical protein KIW84_012760 [Pisum sativum]
MKWLRDGDLNTKFFHMLATMRISFKKLDMLVNEEAVEVKDQASMCEVANNYFKNLFVVRNTMQEPVHSLIQPSISTDDNEKLITPITKEELHEDIIHMHPDKSSEPGGFNPTFYQKIWNMCGEDIFVAITHWMNIGFFLRDILTEVTNLMELLKVYVEVSIQEINMTKSEVFFSHNISIPAQEDLAHIMGVCRVLGPRTY